MFIEITASIIIKFLKVKILQYKNFIKISYA